MSIALIGTTAYHVVAVADRRAMVMGPDGESKIQGEDCTKIKPVSSFVGVGVVGFGGIDNIAETVPDGLRTEFREDRIKQWAENVRRLYSSGGKLWPEFYWYSRHVKPTAYLFGIDRYAKPGIAIVAAQNDFTPEVSRAFFLTMNEPAGMLPGRELVSYLTPGKTVLEGWRGPDDEKRAVRDLTRALLGIAADIHADGVESVGGDFDIITIGTGGYNVRRFLKKAKAA